jgi:hypothetical protein
MEVFDENAFLDVLYQKRERLNGVSHIEVPIAQGETGTDISFTPYGAGDRALDDVTTPDPVQPIGGGPAVGTSRFKDPEAELGLTQNIVVPMTFHADFIRLSLIYMAMNRGARQRINYVKNALRYPVETLKQRISRQVLRGNGTLPQMTGLDQQISPAGNHFLLNRALFPSLIGKVFDSRDTINFDSGVFGGGTNLTYAAPATVPFTVTLAGTDLTVARGAAAGDNGDIIRVGGLFIDTNGTEYTVAAVTGGANTVVTLAEQYDNVTGNAGNAVAGGVFLGQYEDTALYGQSGDFSIQKLDKAYFSTVDGSEYPDMINVDALTFTSFQNELQQIQRWMGSVTNLGQKDWMNFRFHNATVTIDNHEQRGEFRGINTNWCKLYTLDGFDSFTLNKGSLMRVTNGSNVSSVVGEIVVSAQVLDTAPKRSFRFIGNNI